LGPEAVGLEDLLGGGVLLDDGAKLLVLLQELIPFVPEDLGDLTAIAILVLEALT